MTAHGRTSRRSVVERWLVGAGLLALGVFAVGAGSAPQGARPGPTLRAGHTALEAGAHETAARLFARLARDFPIVADHAARWEAHALLRAGQPESAISRVEEALDGPVAPHVERVLLDMEANAHVGLGAEAAARTAWLRAGKGEPDSEKRAERLAERARSHEREADLEAAAGLWLEIWSRYPATPSGKEADSELARLLPQDPAARGRVEAASGLTRLDALTERCRALVKARHNEAALEACTQARDLETRSASRKRLARNRADVLFRLRRYVLAEEAFRSLGNSRETRFWAARSMARSGDVATAIQRFETIGRGSDALAARARFLAGTLWEDRDMDKAAALYASVSDRAPRASQRREADWRLGWSDYRAGRFASATLRFDALARAEPDPIEALRGRYWAARSRGQTPGEEEGAARALSALAAEYPFTYYGWRSSGEGRVRIAQAASTSAPTDRPSALPADILERARILIEGNLLDDAALELDRARPKARSRADRLTLSGLLQAAGRFHEAERLVLDAYLHELSRGPTAAGADLWWVAWPTAFEPEVDRAVAPTKVPRELLYAVMREESGYRPRVVSVVGARGLAQIMPTTGQNLAAKLGATDFDPDELFIPARNLQLAAVYLEDLLEQFDGRASAVIASYNAGENAVGRWVARDGDLADDEWVESIPYDQTRAYVKRVLRSVQAYRALY